MTTQNLSENPYIILIAIAAIVSFFILARVLRKNRDRKAAQIRPSTEAPVITASTPAAPTSSAPAPLSDSDRVTKGLGKTKTFFSQALDRIFTAGEGEKFYDEVEEALLSADVGINMTEKVVGSLKKSWGVKIPERKALRSELENQLLALMPADKIFKEKNLPHIVMIIGVNGAGKTTTIAKLCQRFKSQNKKVIVGAADTYRAAATAQLKAWVDRIGVDGVFQAEGSDPSAVAFDTVQAAVSRQSDVCIIDTAGRLHTKTNLMDELKKMKRVVTKAHSSGPHDVWLVIDGTQGQNALNQAREFHDALELTGLIVTKLDGSAKGGAVLAIASELKLPVIFIGVGETPEDLVPFESKTFVNAMLENV